MWAILRAFLRGRGAQQSRPRRTPSQQQRPAVVETVARPITGRPRRPSDEVDSMKPAKRRKIEFNDGPWQQQAWVQENTKDLPQCLVLDHYRLQTLQHSPHSPHTSDRYLAQRRYMSDRFPRYKHRPVAKPVRLVRTPDRDLPFLWSDEDDSDASLEKRQDLSQGDMTGLESDKQQDFTPFRPSHQRLPSSPLSPEEKSSLESESVVDPEEELAYRRFLRGLPESFDSEGYKIPINGYVSPETKQWNKQHKSQLLQDVAAAQETPSRRPRKSSHPPSDAASSPLQLTDAVKPEPSPKREDVEDVEHKRQTEQSREEMPSTTLPTKDDETTAEKAAEPPDIPKTPAQLFERLKISDTVRSARTPKAGLFSTVKTDRRTRYQKAIEEREAAKARDEYKMVPLGDQWDAKVRSAVRTGTSDDKYKPGDFARCAPMYASPGQDRWLSDVVINDYVSMVAQHGNKNDRPTQVPTYAALSSYLYSKVRDQGPDQIPASWTRRKKIPGKSLLDCETIFIPINEGMHWTLCVIEPKLHRRITMYNSLGIGSNKRHAEIIQAWLEAHLGASYKPDEWSVNWQGDSPQQQNGHDCGVFACTTARQIMLGQMESNPYDSEIMPIQRKRMVAELLHGDLLKAKES